MSNVYSEGHRALQDQFATRKLADRLEEMIVKPVLGDMDKAFIESRDMFFLSTVDHEGFPTTSYKGGDPGFVRVVDDRTIAFPSYDGNGMHFSTGNIADAPQRRHPVHRLRQAAPDPRARHRDGQPRRPDDGRVQGG